jgi:hypothetical protein
MRWKIVPRSIASFVDSGAVKVVLQSKSQFYEDLEHALRCIANTTRLCEGEVLFLLCLDVFTS